MTCFKKIVKITVKLDLWFLLNNYLRQCQLFNMNVTRDQKTFTVQENILNYGQLIDLQIKQNDETDLNTRRHAPDLRLRTLNPRIICQSTMSSKISTKKLVETVERVQIQGRERTPTSVKVLILSVCHLR